LGGVVLPDFQKEEGRSAKHQQKNGLGPIRGGIWGGRLPKTGCVGPGRLF